MNAKSRYAGSARLPLLLGLVLLLSLTAIGLYGLWPQYKNWSKLSTEQQLLERTTRNQNGLEEQLKRVSQEIDELNRELYGELTGLPERQIESFLVGRLQNISWDSDVELISVVPGRGEQIQDFRENLFQVRLQARYRDFFDWLSRVKRDLGYSVIQRFEIRPRPNQNTSDRLQDPLLDINLTLVIYRIENDA